MPDISQHVEPGPASAEALAFAEDQEEREREAYLRSLDEVPLAEDLDNPVNDDVVADHYLERVASYDAEIKRNKEIADRRRAMIDAWERDANARLERERRWLAQAVEAIAQRYDFGKKKSRALPHGTFGYRLQPERLAIVDATAALAFAKAQGLAITVKESVGVTPLKEYFATSGGVLPEGCDMVPASETFYLNAGC